MILVIYIENFGWKATSAAKSVAINEENPIVLAIQKARRKMCIRDREGEIQERVGRLKEFVVGEMFERRESRKAEGVLPL